MESWHQLMELSDDELAKVDVAEQHLLCAKGLPGAENLNIGRSLRKIDRWAKEAQKYIRDNWYLYRRNPGEFRNSHGFFQMLGIVTIVQREFGVQYRRDLMDGDLDWRDCRGVFVNGTLNGFGGTCTSMPVLYTAIGRRLGFPLHLVGTKAHLFCRWEDGEERFNIEGAGRGMNSYPDEHYHEWPISITQQDISMRFYLHNQTPRESLAWYINQRGGVLRDNMQYEAAVRHYYHARELWPNHPHMQGTHAVGTILYNVTSGLASYEFETKTNRLTRVATKATGWREPELWETMAAPKAQEEHKRIRMINSDHKALEQYFSERN